MIIISFILEGILNSVLYKLIPLFTLTSIVTTSYYYKKDVTIKYSVLIGLLYDITYTNTVILNSVIFFIIAFVIIFYNKNVKKSLLNLIILNIISIIFYLIFTYFLQLLFNYINFDLKKLTSSVIKSITVNTIYLLIMSIILKNKLFKHSYS